MVTDYQTKLPNYNLGLKFWYKRSDLKEVLTLQSLVPRNGQTHAKNLAAFAPRFLSFIRPFC